jgi:phytoene desaturase
MRAVVIGGGLGGLATALRLSARGWQVTVCDANPTFGGKMNRLSRNGYVFDTGPSLITMPHVFRDLYTVLGERMEEHVAFVRVDPFAEYRFPCGARVVCPSGTERWKAAIREIEPADVRGFERLQELGRKLYELSVRTFFKRSPFSRPPLAELAALRFLPLRHAWGNYAKTVASHLRSPYLRRIYNRYPTYVGSSPYECPATLLVIPYIEQEFGAWHVRGGLYSIVESLLKLASARGITLLASARAAAIERTGDRASGIVLGDGTRLPADAVVMNGDAAATSSLLGEKCRVNVSTRSLSGFVMLCGAPVRPAGLPHHTVVFSADYETEFGDLFGRQQFPQDPTVYVSAPGSSDSSIAPGGGDALFVMANAPAGGTEWTASRIDAASVAVRSRLAAGGICLDGSAVFDTWHPGRFADRYQAPFGSIYGANSHGWKNAFLRQPNRSPKVRGLYFAGGSSHPGGGTPTVLLSAKITSAMVAADAGT